MRRTLLLSLVVVLIVAAGVLAACAPATPQAPEPPKAQPTAPPAAPQATEPPKAQPTTPPTVAAPAGGGAELLNARCTVCHNLDRVKSAKKTREQWTQTVSRMVGKGAKLNADEQAAVVEYLAKTYAP